MGATAQSALPPIPQGWNLSQATPPPQNQTQNQPMPQIPQGWTLSQAAPQTAAKTSTQPTPPPAQQPSQPPQGSAWEIATRPEGQPVVGPMLGKLAQDVIPKMFGVDTAKQDELLRQQQTAALPRETQPFADIIQRKAQQYNLDPRWLGGQIVTESNGNPNAVGKSKPEPERGLMQIMPGTWRALAQKNPGLGDFEQNAFDPEKNIEAGAMYLRQLLDEHNQNYEEAIPHYNATKNVEAGQKYLKDVMSHIGRAATQAPQLTQPSEAEASLKPPGVSKPAEPPELHNYSWDEVGQIVKRDPRIASAINLVVSTALGGMQEVPKSAPRIKGPATRTPDPEQFTGGFGPEPAERPQPQTAKAAEAKAEAKPAEKATRPLDKPKAFAPRRGPTGGGGGVQPGAEEDLEDLLKQSLDMVRQRKSQQ